MKFYLFKLIVSLFVVLTFLGSVGFAGRSSLPTTTKGVDQQINASMKDMKSLKRFYKELASKTSPGGRKIAKNKRYITHLGTCMKKHGFSEESEVEQTQCLKGLQENPVDIWYLNSCIYNGLKEVHVHKRSIKYTQNPTYLALAVAGINQHCWLNDYFFVYEKYNRDTKSMFQLLGY